MRTLEMAASVQIQAKANFERRINTLISVVFKLLKQNVPIAVIWYQAGEIKHFGSTNLIKCLESLDTMYIKQMMELDEENLINGEEPVLNVGEEEVPAKVMATNLLKSRVVRNKELDRLPFPLSLMSKKEKITYITLHFNKEKKETNKNNCYGN